MAEFPKSMKYIEFMYPNSKNVVKRVWNLMLRQYEIIIALLIDNYYFYN